MLTTNRGDRSMMSVSSSCAQWYGGSVMSVSITLSSGPAGMSWALDVLNPRHAGVSLRFIRANVASNHTILASSPVGTNHERRWVGPMISITELKSVAG